MNFEEGSNQVPQLAAYVCHGFRPQFVQDDPSYDEVSDPSFSNFIDGVSNEFSTLRHTYHRSLLRHRQLAEVVVAFSSRQPLDPKGMLAAS